MNKLRIVQIAAAVSVTIIYAGWRKILSARFATEVKKLFAQSNVQSDKHFQQAKLDGLPAPVQRYFRHVMKDGRAYISYVRLTHKGQFKTGIGKNWVNIRGEQYFTTATPGFIWKGKTSLFTAIDQYVAGKGELAVFLFSVLKVVNGTGEKYKEGELLRWLCESVWFPTNLLPSERIKWSALTNRSATLNFNYEGISLAVIVTFNDADEIVQMEAQRYMGEEKRETWLTKMADYKEINGIMIPTAAEAIWRLKSGDFSYARFYVKNIEYNVANLF